MLSIYTVAVCGIADTISLLNGQSNFHTRPRPNLSIQTSFEKSSTYVDADVQGFRDPVARDTRLVSLETIDVTRGRSIIVVHVACESGMVLWISNEEDALDSVEACTGQLGKSIDSCSRSLRVALKDETGVRVASKRGGDMIDDLVFSC